MMFKGPTVKNEFYKKFQVLKPGSLIFEDKRELFIFTISTDK